MDARVLRVETARAGAAEALLVDGALGRLQVNSYAGRCVRAESKRKRLEA